MNFKKALIATDFSKQSNQLLACVKELITFGLEELVLLHVVDIQAAGGNAAELQLHNQEKLNFEKQKLEDENLTVTALSVIGFPSAEIERVADEENVSVILIASHGKGFIKNVFIGSTASKIIRSSKHTIYLEKYQEILQGVCKKTYSGNFKKVLIPLDFSDMSEALVNQLSTSGFPIEELIFTHVIHTSEHLDTASVLHKEAGEKFEKIQERLQPYFSNISYVVNQGVASNKILDLAQKENVSLIMIPKRSKATLVDKILGTVSEKIVQQSFCSVLLLSEYDLRKDLL